MGLNGAAPTVLEVSKKSCSDEELLNKIVDDDRSVKRSLSPRLVSFKGLLAPSTDLKTLSSRAVLPLLVVAAAQVGNMMWQNGPLRVTEWEKVSNVVSNADLFQTLIENQVVAAVGASMVVFLAVLLRFFFRGSGAIYLLDYACFKPGDEYKIDKEAFIDKAIRSGYFTEKSIYFQKKILNGSGLGEETYIPPSMHAEPVDFTFDTCMKEAETAMYSVMDELLAKSGVRAKDIGVLVVNASCFCPVPSLAAFVVNRYKLRENVEAYNLGGMGCSAGVLALALARDLLKAHKNTYAVVLSTELMSGLQVYTGNDRSMMVGNCIFRWGTSAVLLSNKRSEKKRAKYELMHVVKTHLGASTNAFECIRHKTDSDGNVGISLSKDLMSEAGAALTRNITTLAPKILPISEKLKFASNFVGRKVFKTGSKPYQPNFKKALDHFCIHPGGKAVLDGIEKSLQLSPYHMEPSKMTLHRFGNTSSTSVWYVLAYMEAKNRVKKGDLVWQIALGSGIKVNSAIWKALKNDQVGPSTSPWHDCVDKYPMDLPHATSLPSASSLSSSNSLPTGTSLPSATSLPAGKV